MVEPDLVLFDVDGEEVRFDASEAQDLLRITDGFDAATVSACPDCRSRVLAAVALVDLLAGGAPFARSGELIQLADDAPTLHLYVRDLSARCPHRRWRDPGAEEWTDVMVELRGPSIVR